MTTNEKKYYYGNPISDYGMENGYVDYSTLAKAFDAVLNNDIMAMTDNAGIGYWEQVSGIIDNSEEIEELQEKVFDLCDQIEELDDQIGELEDELWNLEDDNGEYPDDVKEQAKELNHKLFTIANTRAELNEERYELEKRSADLEDEQNENREVFQWYIVSDGGANLLKEINEIVYYNEDLDMYLWGVTHYGTAWDHVLTNIKIDW